jgi:molybdopterin-guanine dinucleotide biosynthesis protein B
MIGIVGWAGSGKTTLLEALLPLMTERGYRVNVIKHTHHDVTLEPPHKDSARMRTAGAAEVLLSSPSRYMIAHEMRDGRELALPTLVSRMSPADLILVEGYKWAEMPKLEVYRPAEGKAPHYPDDPRILAVASDVPAPQDWDCTRTWLDVNQPETVLAWVLRTAGLGS